MRVIRLMVRLTVALLLVALAALGIGYAYLTSDAGMDRIAREVNQRASSDDLRIELAGLRGHLLGDLTVRSVRIADRDGVWVELSDLHVIWRPRQLLRAQAPLELLEIGRVHLLRKPLPTEKTTDPSAASGTGKISDFALYLPQTLQLQEVLVAEPVAGFTQRIRLHGQGDATRYTLAVATLEGVPLSLDATLQPQTEDFTAKIDFHEDAGGVVAALAGLPNNIALSLKADIAANSAGDVRITTAQLQAGTLQIHAAGDYTLTGNRVELALSAAAPDMAVPQALSGMPMSGSADLKLAAKGTPDALAVTLAAQSPHLVADVHRIEALTLDVQATLNPAAWGTDAFMAEGSIGGDVRYNGEAAAWRLRGSAKDGAVTLPDFTVSYGKNHIGGTLAARGTHAQFTLNADTQLTTPDGVSTLTLHGDVDSTAQRYQGDAKGRFTYQKEHFDLRAALDADPHRVEIADLVLEGPGLRMKGAVELNIPAQLADGQLVVNAGDLTPLGRLLKQPLAGSLDADILLKTHGQTQQAALKAQATRLHLPGLSAASVNIAARLADAKTMEGVDVTADAAGVATASLQATTLRCIAKGGMKQGVSFDLNGEGAMQQKTWQLHATGTAQHPAHNSYQLDLATFEGHYDNAPIRMAAPTALTYSPQQSALLPMTLHLADGTLRAEGALQKNQVNGTLEASSLALHKLPWPALPESVVNAAVRLGGTTAAPVLTWAANAETALDGVKFSATAKGDWQAAQLRSEIALQSEKATAQARIALPAKLSLQPFATDISPNTSLQGTVEAAVPLEMFNAMLRPAGHRLGGQFAGKMMLAGTLGAPVFDGGFQLAEGRYDHHATGMCLRNMQAHVSGNKQAVTLDAFSATDSAGKRFSARASLGLDGTPTLQGEADFDHFTLFCGGMMHGQIDGGLAASGTTRAMSVTGKLELGPLNIQIPGARVSSNIPEVEAQWVRPEEDTAQEAEPNAIALDIVISAAQRLFIRGRGLDAEFGGELAITGTAATPRIDGQFDKKRGTFILLDRVLQLTAANVKFQGPMPPSPFLTIEATTKVETHAITVSLSGSAAQPKLTLSSDPALPQDETLALLLFGRQLERISPFEALQLAQATRTLAGLDGGGPGMIGGIRDALGLDRLEVGADADSNVSVSTGKYVTDDVYVGVVQGAKPEDREVVTEITLTPSVSGKTSVDSIGNQSIGIEWTHDY